MSYTPTRYEQVLTLAAGASTPLTLHGDYLYFHTVPPALTVALNGQQPSSLMQGELHQGVPGAGQFRSVEFFNPSPFPATLRLIYGMGSMTVVGTPSDGGGMEAAALPIGAATAARQDSQTTHLATLAASATEAADKVVLAADSNADFANCRSFAITNTGAVNITYTKAGGSARAIVPGDTFAAQVSGPFNRLATFNVAVPVGGAAEVATTV